MIPTIQLKLKHEKCFNYLYVEFILIHNGLEYSWVQYYNYQKKNLWRIYLKTCKQKKKN